MNLAFVSAGAAQGLVRTLAGRRGIEVEGRFGAVGTMLEHFRAGDPCDLLILTRAQVDALAGEGEVDAASVRDVGAVATSIAVRAADPAPSVADTNQLRAALLAADAIYFPDPQKSTAGVHFTQVARSLGIHDQVSNRFRTFPNGATAMAAMAQALGHPIGCTQATEIIATQGVRLVAPLPRGAELVTTYTAAVPRRAAHAREAAAFIEQLTSPDHASLRNASGFVTPGTDH